VPVEGYVRDFAKAKPAIAQLPQYYFSLSYWKRKNQVESDDFTRFFPLLERKCPSSGTEV
jgi:hypothetical protein